MSEQLYRIKPLEWEEQFNCWCAVSVAGRMYLRKYPPLGYWGIDILSCGSLRAEFKTLDAAKAAADAHNREMMLQGLEAVGTTEGE